MRIVLTTPDGLTKTGEITSLPQARKLFRTSWVEAPTDEELQAVAEAVGIPARISVETDPPTISEFGEKLVSGDERQPDGTWRQVWTVEESITLAEAKAQLAELAVEIYWSKMSLTENLPSAQETLNSNADPVALTQGRLTRFRPKLNQVRTDIQAATSIDEAYAIYSQMRDAT